jgi:hypothetical protein
LVGGPKRGFLAGLRGPVNGTRRPSSRSGRLRSPTPVSCSRLVRFPNPNVTFSLGLGRPTSRSPGLDPRRERETKGVPALKGWATVGRRFATTNHYRVRLYGNEVRLCGFGETLRDCGGSGRTNSFTKFARPLPEPFPNSLSHLPFPIPVPESRSGLPPAVCWKLASFRFTIVRFPSHSRCLSPISG